MPTVREPDGLALSSRNRYLSATERTQALALSRALKAAEAQIHSGITNPAALVQTLRDHITADPAVRLDYAAVVDPDTLAPIADLRSGALLAVAAWVGNTRLIDNLLIPASSPIHTHEAQREPRPCLSPPASPSFCSAISGGIAAYKSPELLRALQTDPHTAGYDVRVLLTRAARRFVTPLTFEALTGFRNRHLALAPQQHQTLKPLSSTLPSPRPPTSSSSPPPPPTPLPASPMVSPMTFSPPLPSPPPRPSSSPRR